MKNSEIHIPWIFRSKILKENKKYFYIIIFLNSITWFIFGDKANLNNVAIGNPGVYLQLPIAIFMVWGSNLIIEKFNKVFDVDLFNGEITKTTSEEFCRVKKLFKEGEIENYQQDILKLIYNYNEKIFVLFGAILFISLFIFDDLFFTQNFIIIMHEIFGQKWILFGFIVFIYIYWYLLITPFLLSLLWVLIGILRGIGLIGKIYELKIVYWKNSEKKNLYFISLKKFKYNIKPISDIVYLMSLLIIIFSFVYTIIALYYIFKLFDSNPGVYISFPILVICIGISIFIWPQLKINKILKKIKEELLIEYNHIYENKKIDFLNIIQGNKNETFTTSENNRNDLSTLREIINETEKFDAWPYDVSRIYQLIAVGSSQFVIIFLQLFVTLKY